MIWAILITAILICVAVIGAYFVGRHVESLEQDRRTKESQARYRTGDTYINSYGELVER